MSSEYELMLLRGSISMAIVVVPVAALVFMYVFRKLLGD